MCGGWPWGWEGAETEAGDGGWVGVGAEPEGAEDFVGGLGLVAETEDKQAGLGLFGGEEGEAAGLAAQF